MTQPDWHDVQLVAQAIADQSDRKDLEMVRNRHAYLGTLLDQMQEPPDDQSETNH